MKRISGFVTRLAKDENGAQAIEYALLAALVAMGMATGMSALSGGMSTFFTKIGDEMKTVTVPAIP